LQCGQQRFPLLLKGMVSLTSIQKKLDRLVFLYAVFNGIEMKQASKCAKYIST
jgi:hypothetical protein